jgi:hypothetical protein
MVRRGSDWRLIRLLCCLTALFSAHVAAPAAQEAATRTERLEGGYSVDLPTSLTLSPGNTMPDFVVYRVVDPRGKQLLLIYLGSAPDTRSSVPSNAVSSRTPVSGHPTTSERWTGTEGSYNGTTLIQLKSDSWPRYAHITFTNLSKSESELAERILHSFRESTTKPQ